MDETIKPTDRNLENMVKIIRSKPNHYTGALVSDHTRTKGFKSLLLIAVASCLGFTLTSISQAHAQSLSNENARDLARVTAPALTQVNALRATITTDVVRQLRPDITMHTDNPEDQIILWHTLALNVTAVDHTSELNATGNQINFEQYGPLRTSYALAIIHIAMFEVANAYAPTGSHYKSWIVQAGGIAPAPPPNGASEAARSSAPPTRHS
jgi:hypothetical protein